MNDRVGIKTSDMTAQPTPRGGERAPVVSVIMPAYLCAEYIGAALESVFAQTFTDYEVIVINDGAPDTPQLKRALAPYLPHLLYLEQENRGAAAARNAGLRSARGRFVAFLDADDLWLPDYLAEQISFIEATGADLVYADALLIGDSPLAGRTYMETSPSQGEVTAESLLALRCNVITSGVLARRRRVIEVDMFAEGIRRGHDFDLWLRLAKHGAQLTYQRKVLLKYRVLDSGLSGDALSQQRRALEVLAAVQQRYDLTPNEQATLNRTMEKVKAGFNIEQGKVYLLQKNYAEAVAAFGAANKVKQSWKLSLALLGLRFAPHLLWHVYSRRASPRKKPAES
jgi:glycosyltransferase involved in cell wall biosynthesis